MIDIHGKDNMLKAHIYEMEYSVSPGGIDCWEVTVQKYGFSSNYSDFKTAGDALNYIINLYPDQTIEAEVISLSVYNKLMENL
jgi:hypothetical protein